MINKPESQIDFATFSDARVDKWWKNYIPIKHHFSATHLRNGVFNLDCLGQILGYPYYLRNHYKISFYRCHFIEDDCFKLLGSSPYPIILLHDCTAMYSKLPNYIEYLQNEKWATNL